jgi:hypothetical protein
MRIVILFLAVLLLTVVVVSTKPTPTKAHRKKAPNSRFIEKLYVQGLDVDEEENAASGNGAEMTYHESCSQTSTPAVLSSLKVVPIYWGIQWQNSGFRGDKVTGVTRFVNQLVGSEYMKTASEYSDAAGTVFDASLISIDAPVFSYTPATTSGNENVVAAKICSLFSNVLDLSGTTVYTVMVDQNRPPSSNFCGYHSTVTCGDSLTPVPFIFSWNFAADAGCSPSITSSGHSMALTALTNILAHEFQESVTDPFGNAWYDASGNENADKCVWIWPEGAISLNNPNEQWVIQPNWSNYADCLGIGYLNQNGQRGCVNTLPSGFPLAALCGSTQDCVPASSGGSGSGNGQTSDGVTLFKASIFHLMVFALVFFFYDK